MKTMKKLLSLLLCLAMVLSFFPAAYAEGEGGIAPVEEADAPGGPEERKDPSTRPEGLALHDTSDIDASNADVTGDGLVNSADLIRLCSFLAGDPDTVLD